MQMQRLQIQLAGIIFTMFMMLLALTSSSYAWFTSNMLVSTDWATARTSSDTVELMISSSSSFTKGVKEVSISQVNKTQKDQLMPVSTADLKKFYYCPGAVYDPEKKVYMADNFLEVQDEEYYYHGRVYLQAVAPSSMKGSRMAVYLDETKEAGDVLVKNGDKGELLNAARLGIVISDSDKHIFKLSDSKNQQNAADSIAKTYIKGKPVGDNEVLNGTESTTQDPAVMLNKFSIRESGGSVSLPEKPLAYLDLNKTYTVDIYFYIEGCDPECSNDLYQDISKLHLAFFGVLE